MASKFDKLFNSESGAGFISKDFKIPGVSDNEGEYNYILLDRIEINPANSYSKDDTQEELEILADDIERNSLLHNIVVLDKGSGKYLILSGERRYKAYLLLRERHKNDAPNPYDTIYSRIYKNLDDLEQQIMIDAANLQVRGAAASEEVKFRKGLIRFTDNLKSKFGLDDKEAVEIARYQSGASYATIRRDMIIERGLIPELIEYVDNGDISKEDGLVYARLSDDSQRFVLDALKSAKAQNRIEQISEETIQSAKIIADKEEQIAKNFEEQDSNGSDAEKRKARRKKQKLKEDIEAEKDHINEVLENADDSNNEIEGTIIHAEQSNDNESESMLQKDTSENGFVSEISSISNNTENILFKITADYIRGIDESDARKILESVSRIIKAAKEAKIQIKYGLGEIKNYEE